jgi:hypothetical protein
MHPKHRTEERSAETSRQEEHVGMSRALDQSEPVVKLEVLYGLARPLTNEGKHWYRCFGGQASEGRLQAHSSARSRQA